MGMMYHRSCSRPAFVTNGLSFLNKPRFVASNDLKMAFNWEIKCAREVPAISIKIVRITNGPGRHAIDYIDNFIVPEEMIFPPTESLDKRHSAVLNVQCVLGIADIEKIPLGVFSLFVNLYFWGEDHVIPQTFVLVKNNL